VIRPRIVSALLNLQILDQSKPSAFMDFFTAEQEPPVFSLSDGGEK